MFLLETPQKEHTQPNPQTMVLSPFFFRWLVCQPFFFFHSYFPAPSNHKSPFATDIPSLHCFCCSNHAISTKSQPGTKATSKQSNKGDCFCCFVGCMHTHVFLYSVPPKNRWEGNVTKKYQTPNTNNRTPTTTTTTCVCVPFAFLCVSPPPSFLFSFPTHSNSTPFSPLFLLPFGWLVSGVELRQQQAELHPHTHTRTASIQQADSSFFLFVGSFGLFFWLVKHRHHKETIKAFKFHSGAVLHTFVCVCVFACRAGFSPFPLLSSHLSVSPLSFFCFLFFVLLLVCLCALLAFDQTNKTNKTNKRSVCLLACSHPSHWLDASPLPSFLLFAALCVFLDSWPLSRLLGANTGPPPHHEQQQ